MNNDEREAGYTLVGVLLVFTILAILGMSLVMLSLTSVKTSSKERDNQAVYYVAEAGLNYALNKVKIGAENAANIAQDEFDYLYEKNKRKDPDSQVDLEDIISLAVEKFYSELNTVVSDLNDEYSFEEFENVQNVEKIEAKIAISNPTPSVREVLLIESDGFMDDENRTVQQEIEIIWSPGYQIDGGDNGYGELPPFTVFTNGDFKMGSGTINGDIGTLNKNKDGIFFGNNGGKHNGDIYVPELNSDIVKSNNSEINSPIKEIDESYSIPDLPPFPDIPEFRCAENEEINVGNNYHQVISNCNLNINSYIVRDSKYILDLDRNVKFNQILLTSNYTLKVDLKDRDREIVVDHLDLTNGHIELLGTGKLTIYVTDKIMTGAGSTINAGGEVDRLNIFYQGSDKLTFSGSQRIEGSLYAKDAHIELKAGGGFTGNIFTGGTSFKINGGSYNKAQLFFAPNAFFDMTQGGNDFEGIIIADTFEISGGWNLYYKELNYTNGPISPAALKGGVDNGSGSGGSDGSGNGGNENGGEIIGGLSIDFDSRPKEVNPESD